MKTVSGKNKLVNQMQPDMKHIMPPPLTGAGIKRCFCLTSVCLSRTSCLSRDA